MTLNREKLGKKDIIQIILFLLIVSSCIHTTIFAYFNIFPEVRIILAIVVFSSLLILICLWIWRDRSE